VTLSLRVAWCRHDAGSEYRWQLKLRAGLRPASCPRTPVPPDRQQQQSVAPLASLVRKHPLCRRAVSTVGLHEP